MARSLRGIVSSLVCSLAVAALGSPAAKRETWLEVRSPNFVVICNAGEKQARKTALQFEQIRSVFRQSLTVASAHPSRPITIFAAKDEETLRSLLPEYWVKGHTHPSGIFYVRMNQYYAAVNLAAQGTNPYQTIYHEYYHSLTLPYFPDLPLWIGEGLADFYGNTEITSDHAGLGMPDPNLIAELKNSGGLIPLNILFKVDHTSPYYNEADKTSLFYAESWALTHYLLLGDRQAHRPTLIKYLDALRHAKTQEQAAAEAFGDLKKLQSSLENYIQGYSFYYQKAPPPPKVADSDLQARILSDAEFDALKGGFASARGRNDDARPLLSEAIQLDPKLALAYQNLALVDFYEQKPGDALTAVSRAIDLDPKNAQTRYLRAYLTYFGHGHFSADPQVETDLREAIATDPGFTPPYALLAVWLIKSDDQLPEALAFAQRAVAAEPGNSNYLLSQAQVLARMERFDEAQAIAMRARAAATVGEDRANAESFLAFLVTQRETQRRYEAPPPEEPANAQATTAAETGSSASKSEDTSPAPPSREDEEYDQAAQGAKRAVASGKVLSVSCYGNDLRLTLLAHGVEFALRARNYARVDFTTTGVPPKGQFLPCSHLSGLDAKITFLPAVDQSHGVIQAIELHDVAAALARGEAGNPPSGAAQTSRSGSSEDARDVVGSVTQSACHGRQLEIDVAAPDGAMHFQGTRGQFRLVLPQRMLSGFDVCSQLKGQRVAIRYTPSNSSTDGTLLVLRILPAGAATRRDGSRSASSAQPGPRRPAAQTTEATAEGKVTEVTCTGSEMLVKIAVDGAQITLHARDYSRVTYDQDVGFDTKEFQACTQLKDHTANITYTPVTGKPYNGEIQSVEVEQ